MKADESFAIPFVKAVIVYPSLGRFLIQRRDKPRDPYEGFWELPGGKMRRGETAEVALRREIEEEAGLTLVRILGQADEELVDHLGRRARQINPLVCVEVASGPFPFLGHYFACLADGDPVDSEEGGQHRLLTPAEFAVEFLEGPGRCATLDLLAMRICIRERKLEPFLQSIP